MNFQLYKRYLDQYVRDAIASSNGTNADIANYLQSIQIKGLFVQHKEEKRRALEDARKAFEDHRHWPLDIVLSQLGVDVKIK